MKVYFSHGKESDPRGTKIKRLAALAESMGCHREMINVDLWAKVSKPGSLTDAQHIELMNKMLQAYSKE